MISDVPWISVPFPMYGGGELLAFVVGALVEDFQPLTGKAQFCISGTVSRPQVELMSFNIGIALYGDNVIGVPRTRIFTECRVIGAPWFGHGEISNVHRPIVPLVGQVKAHLVIILQSQIVGSLEPPTVGGIGEQSKRHLGDTKLKVPAFIKTIANPPVLDKVRIESRIKAIFKRKLNTIAIGIDIDPPSVPGPFISRKSTQRKSLPFIEGVDGIESECSADF